MFFTEFNNLFTKNVRISFDQGFSARLMDSHYNKIFAVADTNEVVEKFNSTESMKLPKYVNESDILPVTKLEKGYLSYFTAAGFGDRIIVSKEARLYAKDDTLVLQQLLDRERVKTLDAFDWFIETETHKILNYGFVVTPGFTAPDGASLISANHIRNSTGTTWSNLLAGAALDVTAVRLLEKAAGKFTDAQGNVIPLRPDTCIVKRGSTASFQAKQLFGINMGQYSPTTLGNVNIFQGASYTLIETPFIWPLLNGGWVDCADTVYFFADSRFLGQENPCFVHFVQRPRLEGEANQLPNLDWQYYFYWSFKFGIRALPIWRWWSLWQ